MDLARQKLLADNIQCYLNRSQTAAVAIAHVLPAHVNLPAQVGARAGRLLRYPILLNDRETRDRILQRLQQKGFGATALYQSILSDIAGVAAHISADNSLLGAQQFAGRLLTLPVHQGVTAADVDAMGELLRTV